jgi:hypothetical protein
VRQRLPESAGYPLMAGPPVGRVIHPGDEFDAARLVPGCEPVEDAEGTGGEAPQQEDKPAAKGRPGAKETRP